MRYSQSSTEKTIKRCQSDPLYFSKEILGGRLWQKQKDVLLALRDHTHVAVRSGHGVGKTHVAAIAVLWFLISYYPSKIITTAPTWMQVKSVLWEEIRKLYNKSIAPLGGEMLLTSFKLNVEHFAIGFSTDDPDKFQGHHSPNIMVVFDEAPGVKDNIWTAAEGLMTSQNAKWLCIGNPTTPAGRFYDIFKGSVWHKIFISCLECPNVVQDKMIYPGLVTKKWIEERKREWGINSPIYKARVLGEFPVEGEDTLIPLSWVEQAINRELKAKGDIVIGCDVARFGSDHTAFIVLHGSKVIHIEGWQGKETTKTVGKIIKLYKQFNCVKVMVDDTGVGGGVTDMLNEQNYDVVGVNFGSSPIDTDRFDNLKTEIFWNLREDFESGTIDLIKNDKLLEELPSLMYEITSRGKMKIVGKDKMKKMGIRSPDYADALAIAHYGTYSARKGILDFYKSEAKLTNEKKNTPKSFLNRSDLQQGFKAIGLSS